MHLEKKIGPRVRVHGATPFSNERKVNKKRELETQYHWGVYEQESHVLNLIFQGLYRSEKRRHPVREKK